MRSTLRIAGQRFRRWRTVFHKKATILIYHRVAEANVDLWALGVTPAHFAQQLQVLNTIANPVPLRDLVNAKSDRELPSRPVCITFDDGYADNLYAAKAALEAYRVPATVFVTTGYIGVQENLWWDELAKLILNPASRQEELTLSLSGPVAYPDSAVDTPLRVIEEIGNCRIVITGSYHAGVFAFFAGHTRNWTGGERVLPVEIRRAHTPVW